MSNQAFYFENGEFEKALDVMFKIKSKAEEQNNMIYLYLSERLITECYYYKKDLAKAFEFYELSKLHLDKTNRLKQIELNVSCALITGDNRERIFLDAYNYYVSNSLNYNLAQVSYYLSSHYYSSHDRAGSEKYLNECIALCQENGYSSFLIREYIYDPDILDQNSFGKFIEDIKLRAMNRKNKLFELI
jgi:hypothetical protein